MYFATEQKCFNFFIFLLKALPTLNILLIHDMNIWSRHLETIYIKPVLQCKLYYKKFIITLPLYLLINCAPEQCHKYIMRRGVRQGWGPYTLWQYVPTVEESLTQYTCIHICLFFISSLLGQVLSLSLHSFHIKKNEWKNPTYTPFFDMHNSHISVSLVYHQSCAHTCWREAAHLVQSAVSCYR